MPTQLDYTIAYNKGGVTVDLCKVILGGDGSYYITAPFHPHDKAIASLITVNYARQEENLLDFTRAIEVGVLNDDDRRLKLSHHPDGFLQFSGEGVLSGRDREGGARGLGVQSWPLHEPTLGPSFGLAFGDPLRSGRATKNKSRTVVLHEEDVAHMRKGLTASTSWDTTCRSCGESSPTEQIRGSTSWV